MGLTFTLPTPATTPAIPVDAAVRDVYGYDIAFRPSRGFLLTPGGDFARISGIENVKAAIYRRLITRPGEYRYRPSYGVGVLDYLLKPPTRAVLDQLRQRIIDQLTLDPRLSQVDVTTEMTEIGGVQVLQVYVRAVVGGGLVRFEPYNFKRSAA